MPTRTPGVPDPLYVRARAALLDAVEALSTHRDAIVLVGAQAIYLHSGDADLAVAAYTTDADFAVRPDELADAALMAHLRKRTDAQRFVLSTCKTGTLPLSYGPMLTYA